MGYSRSRSPFAHRSREQPPLERARGQAPFQYSAEGWISRQEQGQPGFFGDELEQIVFIEDTMPSQYDRTDRHQSSLQPITHFAFPLGRGEPSTLFEPSAILPAQFFASSSLGARGERALMQAVLVDAITCFQKQFVDKSQRTQRLASEAEAWLFSDERHWPFSFLNICGVIGLDPEYLRRGLIRWRQHPPATRRRTQLHAARGQASRVAA